MDAGGQVGRAGAVVRVRDLLATHGSLSYALERAGKYVDQSLRRLRGLLDAESFAVLEDIAGFVLNRQR